MSSNNDIIEFLIECLVISKLNESNNNEIEKKKENKDIFDKSIKNTISLSNKMIDYKLDKLTDIKIMENDYANFNLIYSS